MPKDPKKNVDRFKVRGGDLNEYDYSQNQEELAEKTKPGRKMPEKGKGEPTKPPKGASKGRKKEE